MIQSPNWREATSWLYKKHGRAESETTGNKSLPATHLTTHTLTTRPPLLFEIRNKKRKSRDMVNLLKATNKNNILQESTSRSMQLHYTTQCDDICSEMN